MSSRVQLALNVADLEASVAFYSTLFGVEPHKRRPGYANFAITEPPLKLVLIEVPADTRGEGVQGALNHLGVEVADVAKVEEQAGRLREAGLAAFDEKDTTCCYALQDKVWVQDPAGAPWEIYTVKDDDPSNPEPASSSLPVFAGQAAAEGACCAPA
jgi:catechol 2,3-dioxygenase-like lactoylglutathione lyase family enzyme